MKSTAIIKISLIVVAIWLISVTIQPTYSTINDDIEDVPELINEPVINVEDEVESNIHELKNETFEVSTEDEKDEQDLETLPKKEIKDEDFWDEVIYVDVPGEIEDDFITDELIINDGSPDELEFEIDATQAPFDFVRNGLLVREVSNWSQFLGAIADRTVNVIEIVNDFSAPTAGFFHYIGITTLPNGHGSTTGVGSAAARELVINGNNHTINFNEWAICFVQPSVTNSGNLGWDIIWNDLTIFGTNIYGFITFNDLSPATQQNSIMRYHNIEHFGSQLIHSPHGQVIMSGNVSTTIVTHHRPTNVPSVNLALNTSQSTQANIQVQNLTIAEDANVALTVLHAGNIDLRTGGTLELKNGATLTLSGSTTSNLPGVSGAMDEARGINLQIRDGGRVLINANSTLNLIPKPTFSAISMLGTGSSVKIENDGILNIDTLGRPSANAQGETNNLVHMSSGAELIIDGLMKINSTNTSGSAHIMRIGAEGSSTTGNAANRTNLIVNGVLDIQATGMGQSTASLIHFGNSSFTSTNANGGNFIVNPGAHLNLISDSSAINHHLIYFNAGNSQTHASVFEFRDVGYVNLQRLGNVGNNAGLIGMNGTFGNLRIDIQEVNWWQSGNLSDNPNHYWKPLFAARLLYHGAHITSGNNLLNARTTSILGGFGLTPDDSLRFKDHFTTINTQRITMGQITDVHVEIDTLTATDSSLIIRGIATPGAFVRVTDTPLFVLTDNYHKISSPIHDQPYLETVPDLIPNPLEYTSNFSVIADEFGNWELELSPDDLLLATSTLEAFAFLGGKTARSFAVVQDVTAPIGKGVRVVRELGDLPPGPSEFVTDLLDSNPFNVDIVASFSAKNPIDNLISLMYLEGEFEIYIDITDDVGNSREILAFLIVKKPYQGSLILNSPDLFDFGSHKIVGSDKMIPLESINSVFSITDTRLERLPWSLQARMEKDLYNSQFGSYIPVVYSVGGKITPPLSLGNVLIISNEFSDIDFIDVFSIWDDLSDGFFLDVKVGSARVGTYTGNIIWSLVDAP